jgi:hypothetical protein
MRDITDQDWIDTVEANFGKFTKSVDHKYFAFNFFDGGEFSTGLHTEKVNAAKEYCVARGLVLQVSLRRLQDAHR